MKLHELRAAVRRNLQEPDEMGRFPNEVLNAHINEACFEIADRLDVLIRDMVSDVFCGTVAVELPSDTLGIKRVQWNHRVLKQTTEEYLDTLGEWTHLQGEPERYFTNTPNVIRLVPAPSKDGIVRIRYSHAPKTMVDDNDVSDLPSFLVALVPLFATYRAHLSDTDGERKAATWIQLFEARLAQAERTLARRQTVASGLRIKAEIRR